MSTIATHFDLTFSTGQRSAFKQPDFSETSRFGSSIAGPGLPSMGNTSGNRVTPLQQSTPAKLDPSWRYSSEDQLEVKRQSERWRRDLRLAERLHHVKSTSFNKFQRPVLELPKATTTENVPADTYFMPVALTSSTYSTLNSSNYRQSPSSAILEYQQPQLAAVPLITCPQSLQTSYNVSNNYAAAYAIFNQYGAQLSPAHIGQQNTSFVCRVPALMGSGGTNTQSGHVRIVHRPSKPQCWEHGCDGRQFSSFGNLWRHQREKSGKIAKASCPKCGARFTRTASRDGHVLHGKCRARHAYKAWAQG